MLRYRSKFLVIISMFLLLAIVFRPHIALAVKLTRSDDSKEAKTWIKLDKLSAAGELISKNRLDEARMILESLIEQYPEYKEASVLYENLERRRISEGRINSDDGGLIADRANRLWLEYRRLRESGEVAKARLKLIEIESICGEMEVRPVFLKELNRELEVIEKKAVISLMNRLKKIENGILKTRQISSSEKRLAELIGLYNEIHPITLRYMGLKEVVGLEETLLAELDTVTRIAFAKAVTINEFEGCESALPKFRRLKNILKYPELRFYRSIERAIDECAE